VPYVRPLSRLVNPPLTLVVPTVAVGVILTYSSPYFLTTQNLTNIALYASWTGAAAAVATIVICSGGLDLSITSIIVLVAEVGTIMLDDGVPAPLAILIMFAAGAGCGLMNGLIIVIARVNPFIVTLGTNLAFYGAALVISSGNVLTVSDESVRQIGQAKAGQIPVAALVALGVYAAAGFTLHYTRLGTNVLAIGGNEVAASRSGIQVRQTKLLIYVISGLSGALSAWMLIAITGAALPDRPPLVGPAAMRVGLVGPRVGF
jgi:ribose transport system permease protein